MTTPPTPPRDLSDHDRAGNAGTLHTPDPAAVARLKALMAEQAAAKEAALAAKLRARRPVPATPATPTALAVPPMEMTVRPPVTPRPRRPRGRAPKIGLAQARELHARWNAPGGPALAVLAAAVGVNVKTLRQAMRRHGLSLTRARRNGAAPALTEAQVRELHQRYLTGTKAVTLAAEVGLTHETVTKLFGRYGLEVRPRGGAKARRTLSADELARATALHDAGTRWQDVAREIGCDRSVLRREVRRFQEEVARTKRGNDECLSC